MVDVRSSSSSRNTKSNPLDTILNTEPAEIPVVEVVGDFVDGIRFVSSTTMSGLLGFAKLGDERRSVLIPYVEARVEGGTTSADDERDRSAIFSGVLTLENAAFLIVNLTSDMRTVCEELATLTGGTTRIERRRLEQTRYLLAHTMREALVATSQLSAILESYPTEIDSGRDEEPENY